MPQKIILFYGLTFFVLISTSFYQKELIFNIFKQFLLVTDLINDENSMCTTKWYQQFDFEFEVFSAENFSKVIFLMDHVYSNIIKDGTLKCLFFQYGTNKTLKDQFLTRFGGKSVSDPHQHTFCLECSIPIEAIHPSATKISFLLEINSSISINLSICRSYESFNSPIHLENPTKYSREKSNKTGIGACTQTSRHDSEFPLWINYHYQMGVDHFYIYDHTPSNQTTLHKTLRYYLEKNLVTIIPWHVDQWNHFKYQSKNWIAQQIWSQNDCIRRYGHLHPWILISDVDEFVLPMEPFHNFTDLLNSVSSNYCALQILHFGFPGLENETSIPIEDRPKKYVHRSRENEGRDIRSKNFVRPKLINYYSVHQVTHSVNNSPVFYADVHKHARLHHYRRFFISEEQLKDYEIDPRFIYLLNKLNNTSQRTI